MKYFEYEKMTLSGQSYNNKVTVEIPCDADIHDLLQAFRTIAIGLTFHEKSWEDGIIAMADEYKYIQERDEDRESML